MSYQSPIELIMGQINFALEGQICKAVQNVGVSVDKEELLKALHHDRGQYQKGYRDRDAEIVRCKNCKHARIYENCVKCENAGNPGMFATYHQIDWFCADGERAE